MIKGLVFKKNTAHKHMPTNCHNPRLLLLKGALGHSGAGLLSFNSMDQVGHCILHMLTVISVHFCWVQD